MSLNSKNLVIDIGNSYTKMAVFHNDILTDFNLFEDINIKDIKLFCQNYSSEYACIVASVKEYPQEISEFLKSNYNVIDFNHDTELPLLIDYATPETLGLDRRAVAVGAWSRFPGNNILNIDSGTALKYDFVTSNGVYLGGAISPGLLMRYKALHYFTDKLPFVEHIGKTNLIGNSTYDCIASGVLNGILAEVDGIVKRYQENYDDIKIILSGGNYEFFENYLNFKTYTAPNLILEGLNIILNYNLEK